MELYAEKLGAWWTTRDGSEDGYRHPHAVKFSVGENLTDIVVVPLHMKSNVDGEQFGAAQREEEAKALIDQLDEVADHFDDDDSVLIGDTSILRESEDAAELFVYAGFRDLNSADRPTYVTGRAPFDRVFLPVESEFRYSRQYALLRADADDHEQFLSDHHMIVTVIKVLDDDD